jgi:hypothetical protein
MYGIGTSCTILALSSFPTDLLIDDKSALSFGA